MASMLLLMTALLFVAGCSDSSEAVNVPGVESGADRMSVVYQRGNDLVVKFGDDDPRILMRGASYPRWSPDGRTVAAVRDNEIVTIQTEDDSLKVVARAETPRAVAWDPSGERIFFTDGERIRVVNSDGGELRTVVKGFRVLELDVAPSARWLVGTVKRFGYHVRVFDLANGQSYEVTDGCSASFSPDGSLVTNLVDSHRQLELRDSVSGKTVKTLDAPRGMKYDNHFWTNHPEWIAGETEGDRRDIVLINTSDGRVRSVTSDGDATRGDVHIGG